MTHHVDLDAIVLKKGGHDSPNDGLCVMEAVAYFAGERHSDRPDCVSPVIGAFLRRWNDDLDDEGRQKLKRFVPLVVGTNTGQADDTARAWLVTDWMVRSYLPAWLRTGGMEEQANAVASLAPVVSPEAWAAARATVQKARERAAAAGAAAWDAAGDAAGDAARAAAWAAARAAAWDAAGAAAGAAAGDAAWAAAGDAAWAAAWAAAGAAAWAAAGDAAWAAAGDAAWAALKPTVVGLQESALELMDRLVAVGADASVGAR